jgi:hypothetical protein
LSLLKEEGGNNMDGWRKEKKDQFYRWIFW